MPRRAPQDRRRRADTARTAGRRTRDKRGAKGPAKAEPPRAHPVGPRLWIERIQPQSGSARVTIKRIVGDTLPVGADIASHGNDVVVARVVYRAPGEPRWRWAPLRYDAGLDRWHGHFRLLNGGRYRYAIQAWIDPFATWRRGIHALLVSASVDKALRRQLEQGAALLRQAAEGAQGLDSQLLQEAANRLLDRSQGVSEATRNALSREVEKRMRVHGARLDVTRSAAFDVRVERKRAQLGAWYAQRLDSIADLHFEARQLAAHGFDFLRLRASMGPTEVARAARALAAAGLEAALEWSPEAAARGRKVRSQAFWGELQPEATWRACLADVLAWVRRGVRAFWVCEPQSQPLPFWEWLLARTRREHPEVLFVCVSSAPFKMLCALSGAGFAQAVAKLPDAASLSGWYATWRRSVDTLRPHLAVPAQGAAPLARLLVAATASPSYSLDPRTASASMQYAGLLNRIRRENWALQSFDSLEFLETRNDRLLAFRRSVPQRDVDLFVVANLSEQVQEGLLHLPAVVTATLPDHFVVRDLLTDERFQWSGRCNYICLDPAVRAGHIFRIERPSRLVL